MPASTKGDFLLRVKGESMIDAGILDGDLVIVQRAQDARNGEIVVALAGDDEALDEATVKTFYREQGPHPAPARELDAWSRSTRRTCRSSAASSGSSGSCSHERRAPAPDARPGAHRPAARRVARMPDLRRVRDARARRVCSAPSAAASLPTRVRSWQALRFQRRPGDRGRLFRRPVEESPDTAGQDAGASQAAKADGKWNRKQTAFDVSPETPTVRVKRWGKSPPASRRRDGLPNPVRCKANRARHRLPAEGPGSCQEGWSSTTESGLQACYGKSPVTTGLFLALDRGGA